MVDRLLDLRRETSCKLIKKLLTRIIRCYGAVIPEKVMIGEHVHFIHDGLGCVIHEHTEIGNHVRIFQNVTIGKKDVITNKDYTGKIIIEEGVTICSGAVILAPDDIEMHIGKNSVIAANAVVLNSVPSGQVLGGVPAKPIKAHNRKRSGDGR